MEVIYTKNAAEDMEYWHKTNKKIYDKIIQLIEDIKKEPYKGIGKLEPLKLKLTGFWSRRIDNKNLFVYKIHEHIILIAQARYHY